jgi:DNA replication and repair protein RecF
MSLTLLEADNLRIVEHITLEPGPHLNVIAGPNGSGKTTLLEAIHLLALGRTFRSGRTAQLLRAGTDTLTVRGHWRTHAGEAVAIGIERTATGRRIRINGQTALTIGALAHVMPVQVIGPESRYRLTHSARYRRGMIDWGLFHVEPQFYPLWSRYERALQQRNAALRTAAGNANLDTWDAELAQTGEEILSRRADYARRWEPRITQYARLLLDTDGLTVTLERGWPAGLSLAQALREARSQDRERGHTAWGPHRSDLIVTLDEMPLRERGSQGQQALAVVALRLAQIDLYLRGAGRQCVLLLDDIAGELDAQRRQELLAALGSLGAQAFITATEASRIVTRAGQTRVFHVEQGRLTVSENA